MMQTSGRQVSLSIFYEADFHYEQVWHNRNCVIVRLFAKLLCKMWSESTWEHFLWKLFSNSGRMTQSRLCHFATFWQNELIFMLGRFSWASWWILESFKRDLEMIEEIQSQNGLFCARVIFCFVCAPRCSVGSMVFCVCPMDYFWGFLNVPGSP